MAEWLEQASQWHKMYCHDLEAMSSNLGWIELGVHCTSVQIVLDPEFLYVQVVHGPIVPAFAW